MQNLHERCWSSDISERLTFDDIFDMLSTDFSYIDEEVDETEVNELIEYIFWCHFCKDKKR